MKNYIPGSFLLLTTILLSTASFAAETQCKNMKACAVWAMDKTSVKYDLGTFEKRSLKIEKDFLLSEGDPDFIFTFLLLQNSYSRIKREDGVYQVIQIRELKNYQFPLLKEDAIPNSLDFYSVEFTFSNKNKVKNAMQILKKYISKEGRLLEAADSLKVLVTDSAIQLQALRAIAHELNK